ncbi:hypothetical protein A2U01_0115470, partial [Trifolium medium]|nr:hypothetical protein [Trifolium medium]
DVLIQSGLHKALKGNTSNMKADKWEELDLRAASAIRLCLTKNVLVNRHGNGAGRGRVLPFPNPNP